MVCEGIWHSWTLGITVAHSSHRRSVSDYAQTVGASRSPVGRRVGRARSWAAGAVDVGATSGRRRGHAAQALDGRRVRAPRPSLSQSIWRGALCAALPLGAVSPVLARRLLRSCRAAPPQLTGRLSCVLLLHVLPSAKRRHRPWGGVIGDCRCLPPTAVCCACYPPLGVRRSSAVGCRRSAPATRHARPPRRWRTTRCSALCVL